MTILKFILDGCDINFIAEAPEDITLKELLAQTDKIKPHWCTCGIRSCDEEETEQLETEIYITKDSIRLANEDVPADIEE